MLGDNQLTLITDHEYGIMQTSDGDVYDKSIIERLAFNIPIFFSIKGYGKLSKAERGQIFSSAGIASILGMLDSSGSLYIKVGTIPPFGKLGSVRLAIGISIGTKHLSENRP